MGGLYCTSCQHQRGRPVVVLSEVQTAAIDKVVAKYGIGNFLSTMTEYRGLQAFLCAEVFVLRTNRCRYVVLWELPLDDYGLHISSENAVDDYVDQRADALYKEQADV